MSILKAYSIAPRSRQQEAIVRWFAANQPATITCKPGGRLTLSWTSDDVEHSLTAYNTAYSLHDLVLHLTRDEWHAAEEKDRAERPAHDRT